MASLSMFSSDEQEIIVSLPYKVGVYVSHAEDEEGEMDDEREMRALEHCLKSIARLHEDKPFIQEVAKQTLSRKGDWARWTDQSFHALKQAEQISDVMFRTLGKQGFKQYRALVMEVAGAVARAYGEFGDWDDEESEGFFKNVINTVVTGFSNLSQDDKNHPMNVSPAEEGALSDLSKALRPSSP